MINGKILALGQRHDLSPVRNLQNGHRSEAVVDPGLRLRGLEGLHVIDASIMPHLVSGNINAPVMMIGERGADLVLEQLP